MDKTRPEKYLIRPTQVFTYS